MNEISKKFKHKIFKSSDTNVSKFVFEWENPKGIAESVLYRYGSYEQRTVICCSVQSGCPVGCVFCGTGKFFIRNLSKQEIVEQVDTCLSTIDCKTSDIKKFQIMFMSMGEPFLNFKELKLAIIELHDKYPNADLLVSTSAPSLIYKVMGEFISLCKDIPKIGLQFSVHESLDENRKKLIPTQTCTLRQISSLGEFWASFVGRKPFYNYCVHSGNNSKDDANRLIQLFNPNVWETTLSVICEKDESVSNSIDRQMEMIQQFGTEMTNLGASIRIFNPAGQDDIGGGCGQLWYFQEWLKNNNI